MLSAASTTESAITDSTGREGSASTPSAAIDSVMECATVNAVTILNTSQKTGAKRGAGAQARAPYTSTAGSSSETRNST